MAELSLVSDDPWTVWSPGWPGAIVCLVLTKLTDLLTTIFGLALVDGLVERNPVGAWLYAKAGIGGLVVSSLLGVLMVVVVVEWTGAWVGTLDECAIDRRHLYYISYLPLTCVYGLATIQNSVLIATQLS